MTGRVKPMNNDIMENVDAIHNAISQNLKISFQYFQWNIKKQAELRKGGARYVISPWGLSWDDQNKSGGQQPFHSLDHGTGSRRTDHRSGAPGRGDQDRDQTTGRSIWRSLKEMPGSISFKRHLCSKHRLCYKWNLCHKRHQCISYQIEESAFAKFSVPMLQTS